MSSCVLQVAGGGNCGDAQAVMAEWCKHACQCCSKRQGFTGQVHWVYEYRLDKPNSRRLADSKSVLQLSWSSSVHVCSV